MNTGLPWTIVKPCGLSDEAEAPTESDSAGAWVGPGYPLLSRTRAKSCPY